MNKAIMLFLFYILTKVSLNGQTKYNVSGMINDQNGQVLKAVSVTLMPGSLSAQSDSTGSFTFYNLDKGVYGLSIIKDGFKMYNAKLVIGEKKLELLHIVLHQFAGSLKDINISGTNYRRDNIINPEKSAMPLTVIDRKTIEQMGSRRLDEVLKEQTGLAVVSDLGAGNRALGIQMQGFGSEYITILIDGQPLAGRVDGNFDLSRISISGIEKIEIIKGASSSLYGSEALGGVINIVTKQTSIQPQLQAGIRYGTYHTTDANLNGEMPFKNNRGSAFFSADYYNTGGYNVNPYLLQGQTAPPYHSLSFQGRANYKLNDISTLLFSGRYAERYSVMKQDFGAKPFNDSLSEKDFDGIITLDNHYKEGFRWLTHYYFTRYSSLQSVTQQPDGPLLERDNFTEYIHRLESQFSKYWLDNKLSLIGGVGGEYHLVKSSSQGTSGNVNGDMYDYFAYAQANYKPSEKWNIIGGLRYDGNNIYGGKINPSGGINYTPVSWITLKASVGKGFKSPTYAQMYQVFTNLMQGYTVVGANNFDQSIASLKASGEIASVWDIASQIHDLKAETSTSWDGGFSIRPYKKMEISFNGYYNLIHNMINSQQVGIKTNGGQLFSYLNIGSAYTKGLEADIKWEPIRGLSIAGGYQLLYARDKAVIDSIKNGSPSYSTVRTDDGIRKSTPKDYFGLPGRSRNMANLQVFYTYEPWGLSISARASYRGKYGFLDTDNYGFIDPYDVYVKGYYLLNGAVQKTLFSGRLTLQFSVDNINNHTDYLMPAQPGRMFFGGLSWKFFKPTNKNSDNRKLEFQQQ